MTESEKTLKKRVQLIVGSAMTVLFVLVTALAFQFAIRINQRISEARLVTESKTLEQNLADVENYMNYLESNKFIEEYAYELGMGKEGQQIFQK